MARRYGVWIGDYLLGVLLLLGAASYFYRRKRQARWRHLCEPGSDGELRRAEGQEKDGTAMYRYATYRRRRRYWCVGDVLGVVIAGGDWVTTESVGKKKLAMENFFSVVLAEPKRLPNNKVYLSVNALVSNHKKKRLGAWFSKLRPTKFP